MSVNPFQQRVLCSSEEQSESRITVPFLFPTLCPEEQKGQERMGCNPLVRMTEQQAFHVR